MNRHVVMATTMITGILVEGLGSFLDGMFGTGNGTTSTSINVGVIGITKVTHGNITCSWVRLV